MNTTVFFWVISNRTQNVLRFRLRVHSTLSLCRLQSLWETVEMLTICRRSDAEGLRTFWSTAGGFQVFTFQVSPASNLSELCQGTRRVDLLGKEGFIPPWKFSHHLYASPSPCWWKAECSFSIHCVIWSFTAKQLLNSPPYVDGDFLKNIYIYKTIKLGPCSSCGM